MMERGTGFLGTKYSRVSPSSLIRMISMGVIKVLCGFFRHAKREPFLRGRVFGAIGEVQVSSGGI